MRGAGSLAVARGNEAGDPQQRALGFARRQVGDAHAGGFGVGTCRVHGVVQRAVTVQDFKNLDMRDALKAAVREYRADGFAVCAGAAFERVDDGERGLAFAEVAGDGFAEDVFSCSKVEDVVYYLKCQA